MKRSPKTDPSCAVAYIRTWTTEQDLSPDAQRAAISQWAAEQGVAIVAFHEDLGVSGAAPIDKRPALLASFDSLAAHRAGVLLVARRDRLARDVVTAAVAEQMTETLGAKVRSADG